MSTTIRTLPQLATRVANDPRLVQQIQADPAREIAEIAAAAQIPDTRVYRMVVGALGAVLLLCVVGAIALAYQGPPDKPIPDMLISVASAAVGALAGLLAPSPTAQE